MAILTPRKIREMSKEELNQKLQELRNEYMMDKSAVASGTRAEKPGRMKELRRTIARIHTIQKEVTTQKEKKASKKKVEKEVHEKK